jgi:chemotaxis protein methyltransferase CheR
MANITLKDEEFVIFQKIIFKEAGINLSDKKKLLVQSRLYKRIIHYKLNSYAEYIRLVQLNKQELNEMINLITTNETYFFREIEHFEFLQKVVIPEYAYKSKLRVWSAAASVGAEAYSCAMLLDSHISSNGWEIVGTDINSDVIKKARIGLYPEKWVEKIPQALRSKYCLKGRGQHEGQFLVDRVLVPNMTFKTANLLEPNTDLGKFSLIFLRNVLIYFDVETKQKVVDNVVERLNIGGYFIISLTENLNMIDIPKLKQIRTSIYQRVY